MCVGPEQSQASTQSTTSEPKPTVDNQEMNHPTVDNENSFDSVLELASENNVDGFKRLIERDISAVDEVEKWYGHRKGLRERTPLMVAATYGSVDVLKFILSLSVVDVNRSCGQDRSTALHCAASGGSVNAVEVVKLLLVSGADVSAVDANGCFPGDVISVHPTLPETKAALEELLGSNGSYVSAGEHNLRIATGSSNSNSNSPPLSSSSDNESPSSASDSTSSPMMKYNDLPISEKKEYPIDPSLPDIKNSIYATDEFRMFSFKVRPCSRAYSHDWTECPFVHPGENARRRDPRKFHYSCVPCPEFRKGACRRGDLCEYAHGVFECWLHPAQYRTRLCKDGTSCMRRVCFFAHTNEELRPLYVSTGSAVPSPRSAASAAMDMAAALSLLPPSPSSGNVMSPSPFTPPMSPSANGISHSSMGWPQPNVPMLHLPGSNHQSSRLRSSLNARDIQAEEYKMLLDFELQQHKQLLNDLSCFSQSRTMPSPANHPIRTKSLAPSNLEGLFSAEMSAASPRYSDQSMSSAVFSPSHKSAVLNQFQQQQSMLSPINTNVFSPKSVDHPLLQATFGGSINSPGRMSPRGMEMSPRGMEPISPMSSRSSVFSQREKQQQQQPQQLHSLGSREFGSLSSGIVGSPVNSWSKWGSPTGKLDWAVHGDELGPRRSNSSGLVNNGEEPDLSWVQSLVKESPELKEKSMVSTSVGAASGKSLDPNGQNESADHAVLGAWLEQMQLDQLVAL